MKKSEIKEKITIDSESVLEWLGAFLFGDSTQWISDYERMQDVLIEAGKYKNEKIDSFMQELLSDFEDDFIEKARLDLEDFIEASK